MIPKLAKILIGKGTLVYLSRCQLYVYTAKEVVNGNNKKQA